MKRSTLAIVTAMHLFGCKKENVPQPRDVDAAPPPLDAAGCNQLFDGAQRELAAALPSDRSCKANADCDVYFTTVCNSDCATVAIPKRTVDTVTAKRRAIEETTCKKYRDADCPRITPRAVASCAVPGATCKNGDCAIEPWKPR